MRSRNIFFLVVIIVVVIAGAIVLMDRRNTSDSSSSTPSPTATASTSQESTTTPSSSAQTTSTASITIRDFAFGPASVTIKVGDTVTWTNQDSMQHNVKSDSGSTLHSELLNKGQSFSFTFTEAGTFAYHCTPHPFMKGTIIVTN